MKWIRYWKFELLMGILTSVFLCSFIICLGFTITGKITPVLGFALQFITITSTALALYTLQQKSATEIKIINAKIDVYQEATKTVNQAEELVQQYTGYNGQFDEGFDIYSKLVGSAGTPMANSLVAFAISVKPTDTIFLLKVDLENRWYFKVAGRAIHLNIATEMADCLKNKIQEVASPTNIIFKKLEEPIN